MRSAPRFRSSLFRSRSGLNERFLGNIYLVHYPQALRFGVCRSYFLPTPSRRRPLTQMPQYFFTGQMNHKQQCRAGWPGLLLDYFRGATWF